MIRSLALGGALPYGVHRPLERAQASRELPGWLLPGTKRALARSSDPLAWKRLNGPRWWAFTADAVSRAVEANGVFENHARLGATAGLELRLPRLTSTWSSLPCASRPRLPSTVASAAHCCARAWRACCPTRCGCDRRRLGSMP